MNKAREDRKMKKSEFQYVMSMGNDLGEYIEKWIIVLDNRIVASGNDLKKIYREFKGKYPEKTPFVMKVPSDKVMVL